MFTLRLWIKFISVVSHELSKRWYHSKMMGEGSSGYRFYLVIYILLEGVRLIKQVQFFQPCLILWNKKVISSRFEGTWGFTLLRYWAFFSSGISVILILMGGIVVWCSPTVCSFLSFWLTVFGKRRSFTVLWYRTFASSCLMQVNIWKTLLHLTVNDYTICDS